MFKIKLHICRRTDIWHDSIDKWKHMRITLTQLEYITAVDTYRNFVKAAESCHVTQPTLSMQIQKLESQLGVKIFDRSRQPVLTTQIGEEIIAQGRVVLSEAIKIEEIISEMKGEVKGELRVGIIQTLAPYLVPSFAPILIKKYPEINLVIVEASSTELTEKLKTQQIDCALMSGPIIDEDNFYSKHLFYESLVAYVHPASLYAQLNSLTINDIKGKDLWLLNEGHCLRNQVINLCKDVDFVQSGKIEYESSSLYSLMRMVDRNGGLTILPKLAVRDLSDKRKESIRAFVTQIPSRQIKVYTHRSLIKQKLIMAMNESIISVSSGI